jgi:hypothetical protein
MRDLYRQLKLRPYAPPEEIRQALATYEFEALRPEAERVLLNPRRRQTYDRTHRLLTTVGQLRTRLDLQLRPFWARSGNQDFTAARHDARINPVAVMEFYDSRPKRRPWLAAAVPAVIAIGALAVWIAWKVRH